MPPGLTLSAPYSSRTVICSSFFTEELLRLPYLPFPQNPQPGVQVALRSPFVLMAHTALPPPAARCEKLDKDYLLFLIGLLHYSPNTVSCQQNPAVFLPFFVFCHKRAVIFIHLISFFTFFSKGICNKILHSTVIWSII